MTTGRSLETWEFLTKEPMPSRQMPLRMYIALMMAWRLLQFHTYATKIYTPPPINVYSV